MALALGLTLSEARALPASELAEWEAYFALEPWGEDRQDLRFGTLISYMVGMMMPDGKKPPDPMSIFPDYSGDRARAAAAERAEKRRAAKARFGLWAEGWNARLAARNKG
jgi:hypothetical protein